MKKPIRILAGLGAIALIIFLLVITMSFTGNPISKLLAIRAADKYVEDKYSDLNLERDESFYNFKDGYYYVEYLKEDSKDINFDIKLDYLGRLKYDGYKEDVLSKWNTRMRLEDEYSAYVGNIIRNNMNYDFDMITSSTLGDENEENKMEELDIDMRFDLHNIIFDKELSIYIYEDDNSIEKFEEIIVELNKLMEKENIDISRYTIVSEKKENQESNLDGIIGIFNFPKENLDSDELRKLLEENFNEYNKE